MTPLLDVQGLSKRYGEVAVFDLRHDASPCYACLFPPGDGEDELCAVMGVSNNGESLIITCITG